jgi:aminoglycoside phosphotransferase (APT) family kinase protein
MAEWDNTTRLTRFLRRRLPTATDVRVTRVTEHTEGFSQETFSFDAEFELTGEPQRRSYVAKREPAAGLLEPYDLEPEFRVLHALSEHEILSPPTPWYETDTETFERPFYVMEKVEGRVPIPAYDSDGNGPFSESEQTALATQLAGQLAMLHRIDWREAGLEFLRPSDDRRPPARREYERWVARIDSAGFARAPLLETAAVWLERHAPEENEEVLLHGDYRTGNYLVAGSGASIRVTGLLDWEMVHLGDPHEDLAWFTSRLWRGGGALAGCVAVPESFIAAYSAAADYAVDADRLRYYHTLAAFKMAAIELTGLRAFADGRTRDLRMAIFDHQLLMLYALLGVELGIIPEA